MCILNNWTKTNDMTLLFSSVIFIDEMENVKLLFQLGLFSYQHSAQTVPPLKTAKTAETPLSCCLFPKVNEIRQKVFNEVDGSKYLVVRHNYWRVFTAGQLL